MDVTGPKFRACTSGELGGLGSLNKASVAGSSRCA